MIRVDFKKDGLGNVNTTWVREDGNKHSMMGRLLFSEEDFTKLNHTVHFGVTVGTSEGQFIDPVEIKFEEKKDATS